MKIYPAKSTEDRKEEVEGDGYEFDVEALLNKGAEILRREITNLMRLSAKGKLEGGDARDLVAYIKLLSELKTEQQAALKNMTDEELKALKT